jgi:hypothetical protein
MLKPSPLSGMVLWVETSLCYGESARHFWDIAVRLTVRIIFRIRVSVRFRFFFFLSLDLTISLNLTLSLSLFLSPLGTEAARVLLAIEALLSPTSICLPSIPATVAARKYLTNNYNRNTGNNSSLGGPVGGLDEDLAGGLGLVLGTSSSAQGNRNEIQGNDDGKSLSKGVFLEESWKGKRGREEDDQGEEEREGEREGNDKKRSKGKEATPFMVDTKIGAAFGNVDRNRSSVTEKEEEEDDDDSLPDIDIEADPEQ